MSELNPQLAARLSALTHEVAVLRAARDAESADSLAKLNDALDDERRIKASFEQKFFAADGARTARGEELAAARDEVREGGPASERASER